MRSAKYIFVLAVSLLIGTVSRGAADVAVLLDSANAAYTKGNFEKAVLQYEAILAQGYESSVLLYNLGNAYYKTDKTGLSILNYERAKKLSPYDEDIAFNLKLSNQRTIDKIESIPNIFLEDWWEHLKSMHSEKTWAMRCIFCFALFFVFLGVFITSGRMFTKQFGFWLSVVFLSLAIITFNISRSRYNDIIEKDTAIILSSSAEIKNAPSEKGTKLFLLHEGTVVSAPEVIISPEGEWVKVILPTDKDKSGWVKRSSIEFI